MKGVISIAVGKKYISQAKYLALSAILNAPHIMRAVVTDKPEALAEYYDIVIPYNAEYGDPFATKTRLHLYTPFEKTLYIDADSLIINNIDSYWEYLEDNSFVYNGSLLTEGEWYFNIKKTIRQIDIKWLPKFNSGMFLFKKSAVAKQIFDTAYDYLIHQNERGMSVDFFRGKMLPDEPFLAIALAKNNIAPVEDYRRFSRTLIDAGKIRLDVIKRFASFYKGGKFVFPLVVHFCGNFGNLFFLREKIKLFLYFNSPINRLSSSVFISIRKLFALFVRGGGGVLVRTSRNFWNGVYI
ncbi:MAG: hypothetical protein LBG43_03225 [Treponema sp.]|jgi:hypothetical protein|nr:hypothetical protein [Treponema sp.]